MSENEHQHHGDVIRELGRELDEVLAESEQGVYIYLDDTHKLCNDRFAQLLGYASPTEWAAVRLPFPMVFVAPQSHEALIGAYQDAMERKVGATIDVTWLTQPGETVESNVILVPISMRGHLVALHFVEPQ